MESNSLVKDPDDLFSDLSGVMATIVHPILASSPEKKRMILEF